MLRTDRVGDLILSTPFLQELREGFSGAEITLKVSPYCREVLSRTDFVDSIVTEEAEGTFDLAIALAPRTESYKAVKRSGAPIRLGYVYDSRPLVRLNCKRLLTHVEVVKVAPPDFLEHEVMHTDRLARRLGLPSLAKRKLDIGVVGEASPDGPILFHLGDRWFAGGWMPPDILALLAELGKLGKVVVTAGPREKEILEQNSKRFGKLDLRVDLSFFEWAELIASSACLVSPDTGAVHVAAAVGTPVVVAYENANFELCSHQWAPWNVPSRSVRKDTPETTIPALAESVAQLLEDLVSGSRKRAP